MTSRPRSRQSRWQHTFIVRMWQEGKTAAWRGSAEHVQTRQQYYFTKFDDLIDFISRQTQPVSEDSSTNDETTSANTENET